MLTTGTNRKHYQELEEQLASPEVTSDPRQLQKLARERANIEPLWRYSAATRSQPFPGGNQGDAA